MEINVQLHNEFNVKQEYIDNIINFLDSGCTVPFIARYRKEYHGTLDDQTIRLISERLTYLRNLDKRREEITNSITEQGKMTPELAEAISNAAALVELEDIYRPYKQKRRTRATTAREKGLEPLAALLLAHPELKEKIARISLMGGGIATGNWTPAAEFNILVDPEAARIVFTSGVPITMAGLDVTEKALIMPEDFERVRALGNPVSDIVAQWLEFFYRFHRSIGYAGAPMHDPCAVMALIHPEIFTIRPMYVQIETAGEYCRGTTVGDLLGFSGHAPNADVLMDVDRDRFADLLVEAIKFYGEAEA